MDPEGAHILDGRILFTKIGTGNYVQASTVERHRPPPAMAAAVLTPGILRAMDINDINVSLAHANEHIGRETAEQVGIRATGTSGRCKSCAQAEAPRRAVSSYTAPATTTPLEFLYGDLSGPLPEYRGGAKYVFLIWDDFSGAAWPLFLLIAAFSC